MIKDYKDYKYEVLRNETSWIIVLFTILIEILIFLLIFALSKFEKQQPDGVLLLINGILIGMTTAVLERNYLSYSKLQKKYPKFRVQMFAERLKK